MSRIGKHPVPVPAGVTVPAWAELTPAQQEKLAPLRERWDQMPASRRVHALERLEESGALGRRGPRRCRVLDAEGGAERLSARTA